MVKYIIFADEEIEEQFEATEDEAKDKFEVYNTENKKEYLYSKKEFIHQIPLKESIEVPIEVGDTVLGGKFKNRKTVVKKIGKNLKN